MFTFKCTINDQGLTTTKKNLIYKQKRDEFDDIFTFVAYKNFIPKNVPIICQRLSVTPVKLFGFDIKITKISQCWIARLSAFSLH